ncbi:MAG: alanine--tRNA ligase, partial [Chloroflexota bacterium]|nr:alanine--tRNA ligase [Chloroflexota bacterium]
GNEGATGPCSELHYDGGPEKGCGELVTPDALTGILREHRSAGVKSGFPEVPGCHPNCDCERFVELWNLVFMQYYQDMEGELSPLPKPNVDTGMGLERIAIIKQGASNIFDTDLYQPIIGKVGELAGVRYGASLETDVPMRVVAEHTRGATFLISDGVIPGNEGRGYVLRRLIRRAVRFGRKLGLSEPFLTEVADVVIQRMGGAYPDLLQNRAFILRVLEGEEQQFSRVLEQGLTIMEEALSASSGSGGVFSGALAFTLYDTYGFPVEETQDIARERGLTVDMEAFEREMEAQRERGRAAAGALVGGGGEAKIFKYRDLGVGRVDFVGYDRLTQQTDVLAVLSPDGDALDSAEAGQEIEVVLRETPFYAEGGGQVGDTGAILSLRGHIDVSDTQTPMEGLIVHQARVRSGVIAPGDQVEARVDRERRMDVARNHSSTHLLHEALRRVLGGHVRQAGSLVAPDRLRFDFTHLQAMTPEEVGEVERIVNEQVRLNAASVRNELSYAGAVESGYLAFFGEKYGETVRVIDMGVDDPDAGSARPFSREVCGGTHLDRPGEVGLFLITSESSIGSGIRRVEAVTGRAAESMARSNLATLESA